MLEVRTEDLSASLGLTGSSDNPFAFEESSGDLSEESSGGEVEVSRVAESRLSDGSEDGDGDVDD